MSTKPVHVSIYPGRRFPVGVRNAAARLGVSQGHLWHVLKGKRQSKALTERYAALVAELYRPASAADAHIDIAIAAQARRERLRLSSITR